MVIVLKGKKIFTGYEVINDGFVVIDGEKIVNVGTESTISLQEKSEIIDFGDSTILPGLIDSHTHLAVSAQLPNYAANNSSYPRACESPMWNTVTLWIYGTSNSTTRLRWK